MAMINRPDEDEVVDPNAEPQATPDAQGAAASPTPAPKRSRFNDLSRLLYANKGQGKRMAQGAIASADSLAHNASSQLLGAQTAHRSAVASATPAAYTPTNSQAPVTTSHGSGGLTGRGPSALDSYQTDANTPGAGSASAYKAPSSRSLFGTGGRATTQINFDLAPNVGQAESAVAASYQGPNTILDTPGVNAADISQSFDRADQAYRSLNRNPSRQGGGAGRFNDFLIGADGGEDLKAARERFSGLRGALRGQLASTEASDAARGSVADSATRARQTIADAATENAQIAAHNREISDAWGEHASYDADGNPLPDFDADGNRIYYGYRDRNGNTPQISQGEAEEFQRLARQFKEEYAGQRAPMSLAEYVQRHGWTGAR